MSDLIISIFDNEAEAEKARRHMLSRDRKASLGLEDAVIMEKTKSGEVRFRHVSNSVFGGAVTGAFIGMLFGVLILNPVFAAIGLVVGLIMGIVAGRVPIGVDPEVVRNEAASLQPGNSALCILDSDAEKAVEEIRSLDSRVLGTKVCRQEGDLWQCRVWAGAGRASKPALSVL